jgi:hypothetical protein
VSAASASTSEPFETARNLFLREARTLAALRHPNIVHVQTLFEENGTAYMAMDYIEGRDLQDVIDHAPETLTPAYIMELTRSILGALDYLHRDAPDRGKERLLHRDIKPANIRIDPLGTPVIIDFGAARQETKNRSRAAGTFRVVSDGYSPNEFYVAGTEQGPASDLYSLAASLYHCITGAAPAPADERAQKVSNGEDDPYKPLAGRFPGHDPRLLGLIDRATARPLKERPKDAAAWLAAIPDTATRIVEPVAPPPAPPAPTPAPVVASSGGFWKGAAAGGLVLALLGGGAVALAPGLLGGGATGGSDAEMQRQLQEAEASMRTLEADLAEMSGTAAALEEQVSTVTAARDLAEARVQELGDTVNDLRARLREAGDGDGETSTVLRNQLNQALIDQDGALVAQRELEGRILELETALDEARAAIAAGPDPEVEALVSARLEAEGARDEALARAETLEAELQALETRIAEIAAGEAGGNSTALGLERDAALAARDAALSARDAARLDVERAQSDLQRMAANLSEAEAEADRLAMELRAARAEIELMLAASALPNPGPNTPGGTVGACPSFAVAGPLVAFTGPDIYSPQTLTIPAGGSTALAGCTGLPAGTGGFANAIPDISLQLTDMARFRRLELEVAAECDATLLVNTQDQAWHFDDDSNGGSLPILNLTGPQAIEGRIDVWIGTADGSTCDAALEIETWLN